MKKTTTAYDVRAEDYLQLLSTLIRLDLYRNKGRTSINKCLIITIHLVNAGSPEDLNSQLHYESHCLLMFTVTWEIELFLHWLACSTDRRVNSTLSYSIHFQFVCSSVDSIIQSTGQFLSFPPQEQDVRLNENHMFTCLCNVKWKLCVQPSRSYGTKEETLHCMYYIITLFYTLKGFCSNATEASTQLWDNRYYETTG